MDASSTAGLDWQKQMTAEMAAAGMDAPATIIADGKLRRFAPEVGRGESGWYVVHQTEHFTSWGFGDWRRPDFKGKGHTKPSKRLNRKEWRALKKELRERRATVDAERLAVQTKAAELARARWAEASRAMRSSSGRRQPCHRHDRHRRRQDMELARNPPRWSQV
jgi:hypothetical protein